MKIYKIPQLFYLISMTIPTLCGAWKDECIYLNKEIRREVCNLYKIDFEEYTRIFPLNVDYIERFNVITPVKAGTHLLIKAIALITGVPTRPCPSKGFDYENQGKWYFCHQHFWADKHLQAYLSSPYKTLTIVRDPRDQIISQCYYFKSTNDAWIHGSTYDRAKILLQNPKSFGSNSDIALQLDRMNELMEIKKNVLLIRFESLVGSRGGGDDKLQRGELSKIGNFLGISLNNKQMNFLVKNLFGNSWTFRKGEIGNWKTVFDKKLKKICKETLGSYIIEFGYEKDNQW